MGLFSGISKQIFGTGGTIKAPRPSAAELALQEVQQQAVQAFAPQVQGFSERAFGEGIVSPLLQRQLEERRQETLEDIRRRGGAGAEATTTAGIRRLGEFNIGADIATEEARLRNIGLAGQLQGQLGALAAGAQQPLTQQRMLEFQVAQMNQQREDQAGGQLGQLLAGAGLGALTGGLTGLGPLAGAGLGALGGGSLIPQIAGMRGGGAGTIPAAAPQQSTAPISIGGGYSVPTGVSGGLGLRPSPYTGR